MVVPHPLSQRGLLSTVRLVDMVIYGLIVTSMMILSMTKLIVRLGKLLDRTRQRARLGTGRVCTASALSAQPHGS